MTTIKSTTQKTYTEENIMTEREYNIKMSDLCDRAVFEIKYVENRTELDKIIQEIRQLRKKYYEKK